MDSGALKLAVCALSRLPKSVDVSSSACFLLANLTRKGDVASTAVGMGAMELALSALRHHGANMHVSRFSSGLMHNLCFDETLAVKAKQLGAPALLQAALKAHPSDEMVQENAADTLDRIQRFVDATCARADAKMAELIAGVEAAKGGKRGASAPKKAGKGKIKSGAVAGSLPSSTFLPSPPPPPPPPVAADGEPVLTKAQIKRRKAKAAAATRKAAAASGTATGEDEEEGSDASSGDSEPPRSRPPIDLSKDAEFRRRLPPVTDSPLAISPELLAASDAILAAHAALYAPSPSTQLVAEGAMLPTTSEAAGEEEGAETPGARLRSPCVSPPGSASETSAAAPSADTLLSAAQAIGTPAGTGAAAAAGGEVSSDTPLAALAPPASPSPETARPDAILLADVAALRAALAGKEAENVALRREKEAEAAALRARVAALEAELSLLRR